MLNTQLRNPDNSPKALYIVTKYEQLAELLTYLDANGFQSRITRPSFSHDKTGEYIVILYDDEYMIKTDVRNAKLHVGSTHKEAFIMAPLALWGGCKVNLPYGDNGKIAKFYLPIKNKQLLEIVQALAEVGLEFKGDLAIVGEHILVVGGEEILITAVDTDSCRIKLSDSGYERVDIINPPTVYRDKIGRTIYGGDILYYSYPLAEAIIQIHEDVNKKLYGVVLLYASNGEYRVPEDIGDDSNDVALRLYAIDGDGELQTNAEHLEILSCRLEDVDLKYATENFPLKDVKIEVKVTRVDEYAINIGDTVSVNFHGSQSTLCHRAEVIGVAGKDGVWIFKDLDTNTVHHVSEPCTVSKVLGE